jgi:uncharacterized protein
MELNNEFVVSIPLPQTWGLLTDVERIAPCMPGARLQEVEGDEYRGTIKVKVGPITAEYRGAARFVEKDDSAHRAVLRAEGRETRGQGNASATITAALEPLSEGTRVSVSTDLQITGKVAQFGRGVIADVSSKLIGKFVENLEMTVLEAGPPPGEDSASGALGVRSIQAPAAEPVDLLEVAGRPVARRIVPALGTLLAIGIAVALIRRVRRRSRARRGSS